MVSSVQPFSLDAWMSGMALRRRVVELVRASGLEVYLVGGTVRDAMLGRSSCDIDLAVNGPALPLARRMADSLRAAYMPLDVERDVGRALIWVDGVQHHIDVARLRAEGIHADLWARDFSVNAMAVRLDVDRPDLWDPTGGCPDLQGRTLRVLRPDTFADDPVRILRAVRLRGSLGFALTAETEASLRAWMPALVNVSPERIRDELLLILALEDAAESLEYARRLGLLDALFPEFCGDTTRAASGIARVGGLQGICPLERLSPCSVTAVCDPATLPEHLRLHLRTYWNEELAVGRCRWLALRLAALLSALDSGERGGDVAVRLRLSQREARAVSDSIRSQADLSALALEQVPGPLAIYRYFRDWGEAGVDGAVLSLADQTASSLTEPSPRRQTLLQTIVAVLTAWFEKRDALVDPPALINGRDVICILRTHAGEHVGNVLETVREAQVQGLVRTRRQALALVRASARFGT